MLFCNEKQKIIFSIHFFTSHRPILRQQSHLIRQLCVACDNNNTTNTNDNNNNNNNNNCDLSQMRHSQVRLKVSSGRQVAREAPTATWASIVSRFHEQSNSSSEFNAILIPNSKAASCKTRNYYFPLRYKLNFKLRCLYNLWLQWSSMAKYD